MDDYFRREALPPMEGDETLPSPEDVGFPPISAMNVVSWARADSTKIFLLVRNHTRSEFGVLAFKAPQDEWFEDAVFFVENLGFDSRRSREIVTTAIARQNNSNTKALHYFFESLPLADLRSQFETETNWIFDYSWPRAGWPLLDPSDGEAVGVVSVWRTTAYAAAYFDYFNSTEEMKQMIRTAYEAHGAPEPTFEAISYGQAFCGAR